MTSSRYWYRRYLLARNLTVEEAKHVSDAWELQGYPRDTKIVLTNGANRLDVFTVNKARDLFNDVQRDYIEGT